MSLRFYLGTHMPHWLGLVDVPLFISRTRLAARRTLPVARGRWACDSGASRSCSTTALTSPQTGCGCTDSASSYRRGIGMYAAYLSSADSLAWSYRGKHVRPCAHGRQASEANCHFALDWRTRVLRAGESAQLDLFTHWQGDTP